MAANTLTGWRCVNCGRTWGGDDATSSHGVCINCFAKWINDKRKKAGIKQCFGEYSVANNKDCQECPVLKFCIEYMEYVDGLSV